MEIIDAYPNSRLANYGFNSDGLVMLIQNPLSIESKNCLNETKIAMKFMPLFVSEKLCIAHK